MCNCLHGVAENQARFPKECLKIVHRTRFRWSNSRHAETRFQKCGRKAGTESKKAAENRPPPEKMRGSCHEALVAMQKPPISRFPKGIITLSAA